MPQSTLRAARIFVGLTRRISKDSKQTVRLFHPDLENLEERSLVAGSLIESAMPQAAAIIPNAVATYVGSAWSAQRRNAIGATANQPASKATVDAKVQRIDARQLGVSRRTLTADLVDGLFTDDRVVRFSSNVDGAAANAESTAAQGVSRFRRTAVDAIMSLERHDLEIEVGSLENSTKGSSNAASGNRTASRNQDPASQPSTSVASDSQRSVNLFSTSTLDRTSSTSAPAGGGDGGSSGVSAASAQPAAPAKLDATPTAAATLAPLAGAATATIDWAAIKANGPFIQVLDTNTYTTPAVALKGLNTVGWEDSLSVSWDGKQVSYTYFRADPMYYLFFNKLRIEGPALSGWPSNVKYPGADTAAEVYVGKRGTSGSWTVATVSTLINTPLGAEGCQQITFDAKGMYFSRSWNGQRALFYSAYTNGKYTTPVMMPSTINGTNLVSNTADNPFLTSDNKTMYFESGPANDHKIWSAKKTGANTYSTPVLLPTINEAGVDITQPWVSPDNKTMLYSRNHNTLYKWDMSTAGAAPKALVTVGNNANAAAIGEPTMDKYGNLYFVYVFKAPDGAGGWQFDADLYMLRAKGSPI